MNQLEIYRRQAIQIDSRDNIAVALVDLQGGTDISVTQNVYKLVSDIPAKHKFALRDFAPGDSIYMYGVLVGKASRSIACGERIRTDNLRHESAPFHPATKVYSWQPPDVTRWRNRTFGGYRRHDGQVGTRNYWLVVPLVFCENRNIRVLQEAFDKGLGQGSSDSYVRQVDDLSRLYAQGRIDEISAYCADGGGAAPEPRRVFPNIDGVKCLTHEGGCGGTREDARMLCGLIAGYIHHPNVAGATVLSLGCQNAQISMLREEIALRSPGSDKPLLILDHQQSQLESAMLSEAIHATFRGLIEANAQERVPVPLSELTIGLKCGGSDGFSGISANPAIGHVSDQIIGMGGRSILSEFPELCGVEQSLIDRCDSTALGERFADLMHAYAARARAIGTGFDMNPSPGNIQDGLITDAMKSAGAVRKGGAAPISGVLDYPEYATTHGLNLLCTPGNDVEAVTAQVGAGANIVLFTTGLGTPTGNPIAPVVKLSSNSSLAARMPDIIDFDCGGVVTGEKTIEQCGDAIMEFIVQVASGKKQTKAEIQRQDDFIPWKRGISL